jgi:hypothetical protein
MRVEYLAIIGDEHMASQLGRERSKGQVKLNAVLFGDIGPSDLCPVHRQSTLNMAALSPRCCISPLLSTSAKQSDQTWQP